MTLRAQLPVVLLLLAAPQPAQAADLKKPFQVAGENGVELREAVQRTPEDQRAAMEFLIAHMPERDLKTLSADYLLENVELAYQAWREAPWHEQVSESLFLNNILPYASINERRDNWRPSFFKEFAPLVKDAESPGEAAAILNNNVFKMLNVKYSTKRRKADQSPLESIESGLASCTGLSVLLIDACRAVGVPARFVGTPLWSDRSGNHSWVEVWDDGWRFTGAAEPSGMELDRGWFVGRAARAQRDHRLFAIYATSFKRTPLTFPMVWDRDASYVSAVNVTDRYTADKQDLPAGKGYARFRVLDETGERVSCQLEVVDEDDGEICFEGATRDERFDGNDHLSATLSLGKTYTATAAHEGRTVSTTVKLDADEQLYTIALLAVGSDAADNEASGDDPLAALKTFLATPRDERADIAAQGFADVALNQEQAATAQEMLWADHRTWIKASRAAEMEARELVDGELKMPFAYSVFGDMPEEG
ncbi:MAG: transglutaminase-like domain-containing protein, partial [Planctomycetota bacterium]